MKWCDLGYERFFWEFCKNQADSTLTSQTVVWLPLLCSHLEHRCLLLLCMAVLITGAGLSVFTWFTASWHNKKQFVANLERLWLRSILQICIVQMMCVLFRVICHGWVMWFPLSFVWGWGGGGRREGGGWRAFINSDSAPFESMQRVSSEVKAWILAMDDWPQGQCELCRAARWPRGGEAKRKWTWRSDQNIVWQGNKVKWSRLQFLWKVNQWGFCLNGNAAGYRVMVSL